MIPIELSQLLSHYQKVGKLENQINFETKIIEEINNEIIEYSEEPPTINEVSEIMLFVVPITIIAALVGFVYSFVNSDVIVFLITLFGGIALYSAFKIFDVKVKKRRIEKYQASEEHKKKLNEYEKKLKRKVETLEEKENRLAQLKLDVAIYKKKIIDSDVLPKAYNNIYAIQQISTYFENRRADSYKEAFNLYEKEQREDTFRAEQRQRERDLREDRYFESIAMRAIADDIHDLNNKIK